MNKKGKQEKMTPAAFQQLVEEELGFVQVAEPLKEKIYQGCQKKQHHWRRSCNTVPFLSSFPQIISVPKYISADP